MRSLRCIERHLSCFLHPTLIAQSQLLNLVTALNTSFGQTSQVINLEEAIVLLREAEN